MIKAILVFNNHGKPRLTKFFAHYVNILCLFHITKCERRLHETSFRILASFFLMFLVISVILVFMVPYRIADCYFLLERREVSGYI